MWTHVRPQAVVFDAVGTLIVPDPPVAQVYGAAGRRHGSPLSDAECLSRFRDAFAIEEARDREQAGWPTSEARERQRWRSIVGRVFDNPFVVDIIAGESLFDELWNHFAQPSHWRIVDGVEDVWRALDALGLRVAIASNFDTRLESICRGLPPLDRCEHVFVSSRLGVRKPASQFFRQVAESLGIESQRLLMVGDDLDNDYHAARAAGWQALHFNPHGKSAPAVASLATLGNLTALFTSDG